MICKELHDCKFRDEVLFYVFFCEGTYMLVFNVQLCWTVSVMFLNFVVTIMQKSGVCA